MATAVAEKTESKNPLVLLRDRLNSRANELKRVLPPGMSADKFIRVVETAVQLNTELLTVNWQSMWNACMRAAQDGLLPDGREGVIVPFRDNNPKSPTNGQTIAQWMPMVYGLLKRVHNSGEVQSVSTNIVREKDEFSYFIDEHGEHLRHTPADNPGKPIKTYAIANLKGGGVMVKVMTHAEVEQRRAVSRAKDGPMWREWWDEAAQKTVLRNLTKRLPMSSDADDLIRRDEQDELFDTATEPRLRPVDAASALDYFSGATTAPSDESTSTDESTSNPETESEEALAQKAGVKAHKGGMARKAVPPEYRTPENSHLAKAWLTGWDSVE